nr:cytochrome c oxidase subunit 3 [Pholas orientalis]
MGRSGYPLVEHSPWPLITSTLAFSSVMSVLLLFHDADSSSFFYNFNHEVWPFCYSLFFLGLCLMGWWGDVVYEGVYLGRHTSLVVKNFRMGFRMFILSEVFFFVSFFWAFLHVKIGELSCKFEWPPMGIQGVYPGGLPLWNTALLVSSAGFVTLAHKYIIAYNKAYLKSSDFYVMRSESLKWLGVTVILGAMFVACQAYEYYICPFCISDGAFGSCFFVMTGFHGLHVMAGIIFLSVAFGRLYNCHFSKSMNMFNVTAAIWYWHFVDVVWILLMILVYCSIYF